MRHALGPLRQETGRYVELSIERSQNFQRPRVRLIQGSKSGTRLDISCDRMQYLVSLGANIMRKGGCRRLRSWSTAILFNNGPVGSELSVGVWLDQLCGFQGLRLPLGHSRMSTATSLLSSSFWFSTRLWYSSSWYGSSKRYAIAAERPCRHISKLVAHRGSLSFLSKGCQPKREHQAGCGRKPSSLLMQPHHPHHPR